MTPVFVVTPSDVIAIVGAVIVLVPASILGVMLGIEWLKGKFGKWP